MVIGGSFASDVVNPAVDSPYAPYASVTLSVYVWSPASSGSVSYRKSGGLTIPVFFFDSFYIPNDMDFSLNFNWDTDIKLMATSVVEDLTDFNEQTNNTSWSLKPNVTYSFTRWVNGNFYFVYGVSENKTTGKNEEKDFGFSVNIKIQG